MLSGLVQLTDAEINHFTTERKNAFIKTFNESKTISEKKLADERKITDAKHIALVISCNEKNEEDFNKRFVCKDSSYTLRK